MFVVIDTNVILRDPLLRDHKWQVAKHAVEGKRLQLVLPEVVRLEAIGGFRRSHDVKISAIKRELRKSSGRAKDAAKALLQVYAEEVDQYEAVLDARLREIGFQLAAPPESPHLEVTQRAVSRIAPFDENGGGYRDTLIWLTALEQIQDSQYDDLILISDDTVFTNRRSELQDELSDECDGQLVVLKAVSALEFPGEYESGSFSISDIPIEEWEVARQMSMALQDMDITRWSPPGPDHAVVQMVKSIDLLPDSLQVKKRYGSDLFEVQAEAMADVEAKVLIIDFGYDDVDDVRELSAEWKLHVRWQATVEGALGQFVDEGEATLRSLDDGTEWGH